MKIQRSYFFIEGLEERKPILLRKFERNSSQQFDESEVRTMGSDFKNQEDDI